MGGAIYIIHLFPHVKCQKSSSLWLIDVVTKTTSLLKYVLIT